MTIEHAAPPDGEFDEQIDDDAAAGSRHEVENEGDAEDESVVVTPVSSISRTAVEQPAADAAPALADMKWYVLKVQSNREKSIRESLQRRIRRDGLDVYFGQIVIPTEKRQETKGGKKRVVEHKLYPGYIMIQMVLNDETWYLVRDTGGVGDFTGAAGKPLPMDQADIERMLKVPDPDVDEVVKVKINLVQGDSVKIKEGPFESFEGTVNSIDVTSGKVSVLIEIFGRSTPVDLEYWQVERV